VIVQAIAGLVTVRLRNQVDQTTAALNQSRDEQERMLLADEESRKQISGLLLDLGQAGLITSYLELQMLASDKTSEGKQRIKSIVERLENLRSMDVRSVAYVLSPNLADYDLFTALDELATQYETVKTTIITFDPKIDSLRDSMGEKILLGTYRVIEQDLLVVVGHGHPRNCAVTVDLNSLNDILILVQDDGVGFQRGPSRQGGGSALISTWTRSLEGSWGWNDNEFGGAILTACTPISF
jgi:signal transduction histidine kinase